jgi:hypothetical protein
LPEDEFHELGLLLASYLIRQSGHQCVYLGANVPTDSVIKAIADVSPQNFLTFFIHKGSKAKSDSYLKKIITGSKDKKIFIAGNFSNGKKFKKEDHIIWLQSVDELVQHLE